MHPIEDLQQDWKRARQANDPCVDFLALATVDQDGQPSVRTLILWDVSDSGLVLLTNTTSPKWRQLLRTGKYELLILWTTIWRQYRLRGSVAELTAEELPAIWNRKRYELKLLDHLYEGYRSQSERLPSPEEMALEIETLSRRFPDPDRVPIPETAKGIRLLPTEIDVWDGSHRFPARWLYRREGQQWRREFLVP